MDSDGAQCACKAPRDGVADALGLTDADDSRIIWRYEQRFPHPFLLVVRLEMRDAVSEILTAGHAKV